MNRPRNIMTLSDQLRDIIENGSVTRYRLSKESGVDASQLCRFVKGKGKLTTDTLDAIGKTLRLRLVVGDE